MKTFVYVAIATALAFGLFATQANSALAPFTGGVDFNQTGSATQTDFFAFNLPSSGVSLPASQTYSTDWGDLTVTLVSGIIGNFNRGGFTNGGAFTYADLLNDFTYHNFSPTIRIQLSGPTILPNSPHQVTIWAVDPFNGSGGNPTSTIAPTPSSGTLGGTGIIVDDGSAPTSNLSFSTTVIFTANGSGVIDLSVTDSNGAPRVNGLMVGALPEPSALGLLTLGGMFLRRSRRMR